MRKCGLLFYFFRRISFYSVCQGSEGQEPRRVFGVLSRADRFREREGQRGQGQGGDGDLAEKCQ